MSTTVRLGPTSLLLALGLAACGPAASDDASSGANTTEEVESIRTADPDARGYNDEDFPRVQEVGDGVYTYEQLRSAGDERFTTVSLFVVTEEGVVLADGQGSVEETERLVDHIGEITDQPITHVVIGSDHGDHTGGNAALPEDARYYAHPTSAAALESRAESADDPSAVRLATDLVEDRTVLELGGREIDLRFLGRAHTGGDLVVYLPEEKVLFMSEAYLHRVFPAMRSAFPSEWVEMIERAQSMDVDMYVPGHGFVDSPGILEEELEVYQSAIEQVIDEARRLHDEGLTLEEAQEQADFGALEDWSLRASQGPIAIRRVYAELNGELPGGER
ncbi:MAG: MBL fold metallo-hydrolase [Gemmatimonadota bacterium]|nr:MBL fold metallo-hydrolase [Gemmatimonadota bacterium]